MRTIASASASDGLGDDFLGLVRGGGAAVGVHFSEILSQFVCKLPPPLVWDRSWLEGAEADRLVLQHTATQQPLNEQLLVGGAIFGSVNHVGKSNFLAQSARLLPGLNGKFQTHCLGNGNQCGQARIAVRRQCSVKALTLDTSGLGHLGNTTPGFSYPAQGYQEHPRLLRVLQRRPQVFGGEVWVFAKLPSHRFVMRGAGLVFHGLRVLSL
jgi:hypothetical protein